MNIDIRAKLLGTPELWIGADRLELSPNMRSTLICYLAWSGDWVSRDSAAHLFWNDRAPSDALRNLRQLLHSLRQTPLEPTIEVGNRRLRFLGKSDVEEFRASLEQHDWDAAVDAWTGPFLDMFIPSDKPEILAWIETESAALTQEYISALAAQAKERELRGDPEGAAERLGRVWRLDALNEDAIARELELLHASGSISKAVAEARAYRQAFEQELEMAPSGEIAELLDRFESRLGSPPPAAATAAGDRPSPSLPAATTEFIGREGELEQLVQLIQDGARMISVVGIGGIGKTRLILEAGHRLAAAGSAVRWCSLVSVAAPDDAAAVVAASLGVSGPRSSMLEAMVDAIGADPVVMLLDNAEHLRDTVRRIGGHLLSACPNLTILVSSRAELGMRSERCFPLEGLRHTSDLHYSEAAEMFAACARRRDPAFRTEDHEEAVELLCREVGGMPLALELLASWSGVLTPSDMVEELQSGLHRVEFMAADVPERQRSLQVVLDSAWERLTRDARDALLILAPCRGGFDLETARALGASPHALRELVGVALLRRGRRRFGRHPLVWRYSRHRVMADTDRWEHIRRQHARHFLDRLEAQRESLATQEDTSRAEQLWRDDFENLRRAILWSAERDEPQRFLMLYFLYVRLEAFFSSPIDASFNVELQQRVAPVVRAHLELTVVEEENDGTGELTVPDETARCEEMISIARAHGDVLLEGRALSRLSEIARRRRDASTARDVAEQAIATLGKAEGVDEWMLATHMARAHRISGMANGLGGHHRAARRDFEQSVAVLESASATPFAEIVRLAYADLEYGEYAHAARGADRAFAALQRGSPMSTRVTVREARGVVSMVRGDLAAAEADTMQALDLAGRVFDAEGSRAEQRLRAHLGYLWLLRGDLSRARSWLADAGDAPESVLRRARWHWHSGDLAAAVRLLTELTGATEVETVSQWRGIGIQARSLLAHVHLDAGNVDRAAACAGAALAHACAAGLPRQILFASVPTARVLLAAGNTKRGRRALEAVAADAYADHETRMLVSTYGANAKHASEVRRSADALRTWARRLVGALAA